MAKTEIPFEGMQLGDWLIDETLGGGGQARVFGAHRANGESSSDKKYAIKILHSKGSSATGRSTQKDIIRFRHEVQILQSALDASCQGIIEIVDAADPKTSPQWYVMKRLAEGPIRIADRPPKYLENFAGNVDRVLEVVGALAETLTFLHEGLGDPVTHRDVKTKNILLDQIGGKPYLGDFGIAYSHELRSDDETLTSHNESLGPSQWRPPELETGPGNKHLPASDIYMLGGVLYELLSGGKSFRVAQHANGQFSHESKGFDIGELISDPRIQHINVLLRHLFAFDPGIRLSATELKRACNAIQLWKKGEQMPSFRSADAEREARMQKIREIHGVEWRNCARESILADLNSLSHEIGVDTFDQKGFTRKISPNLNQEPLTQVGKLFPDFEWASLHARIDFAVPSGYLFIEMRHVPIGRNQNGRELVLGINESSSGNRDQIETLRDTYAGDVESRSVIRNRIEAELEELDIKFDLWLENPLKQQSHDERLSQLVLLWAKLQSNLTRLAVDNGHADQTQPFSTLIGVLTENNLLTDHQFHEIRRLHLIRSEVVLGQADPSVISYEILLRLRDLTIQTR